MADLAGILKKFLTMHSKKLLINFMPPSSLTSTQNQMIKDDFRSTKGARDDSEIIVKEV